MCCWLLVIYRLSIFICFETPEAFSLGQQSRQGLGEASLWASAAAVAHLGRHYLSNATCLIRPHSFYALFVESRIAIICQILRHLEENLG